MYKNAYAERPKYALYLIANVFITAVRPFVNILFWDDLIDCILIRNDFSYVLYMALLIILGNVVLGYFGQLLSQLIKREEDWLQVYYYRVLNEKSMSIKYAGLEKPEIQDRQRTASDGLWYSNGIQGLSNAIGGIIIGFFTIFGTAIVIFDKVPFLTLLLFLITIINSFCIAQNNKIDINFLKKLPRINRTFSYVFLQLASRQYAKDIRLYDSSKMVLEIGEKTIDEQYEMFLHNAKRKTKWESCSSVALAVQDIVCFGYLGVKAIKKIITIGDFNSLYLAATAYANSLFMIIQNAQNLVKNIEFIYPLFTYMEMDLADNEGKGKIQISNINTVEFRNVWFRYPGTDNYTLENINITIYKGMHLTLVGANGSGKSTFVKLLLGLYEPSEGEIYINDINIRCIDIKHYRMLVSVLFQDFKLFSFSIKDNIRFGNMNSAHDVYDVCKKCGVDILINKQKMGMDTFVNKDYEISGVEFSGGECQKIGVARAEYRDANMLILDEPTSALDPLAERDIYNMFNDISLDKTVIFISHRMSSCNSSDRVVVFDKGTIVQQGTHNELLKDDRKWYYQMYNEQAKYYQEDFLK